MNGEAGVQALALPVEEHGVRHRLVPAIGAIAPVHAGGVELIIALRGGGEAGAAARRELALFAPGGRGPIIGEVERIAGAFAEHIHALRQGTVLRLADIEEEIEVAQHILGQPGLEAQVGGHGAIADGGFGQRRLRNAPRRLGLPGSIFGDANVRRRRARRPGRHQFRRGQFLCRQVGQDFDQRKDQNFRFRQARIHSLQRTRIHRRGRLSDQQALFARRHRRDGQAHHRRTVKAVQKRHVMAAQAFQCGVQHLPGNAVRQTLRARSQAAPQFRSCLQHAGHGEDRRRSEVRQGQKA